jgi:flagellar biosynthesis GTPase FlhF
MNNEEEGGDLVRVDGGTLATLTSAEIDTQIRTARAYPRDVRKVQATVETLATMSVDVAEECGYSLPRKKDGKKIFISGASVRFAEILVSCWGNARAAARIIGDDGTFVTAQGIFHDLQSNMAISVEVRRRVVDKYGRRYSEDMIATTGNAAASIALRNAILRGIPKAIWNGAYLKSENVSKGDEKSISARRIGALKTFAQFGAEEADVVKILGVPNVEAIGVDELKHLRGIAQAIRDGETTIDAVLGSDRNDAPVALPQQAGAPPIMSVEDAADLGPAPDAEPEAAPAPKAKRATKAKAEPEPEPEPQQEPEQKPRDLRADATEKAQSHLAAKKAKAEADARAKQEAAQTAEEEVGEPEPSPIEDAPEAEVVDELEDLPVGPRTQIVLPHLLGDASVSDGDLCLTRDGEVRQWNFGDWRTPTSKATKVFDELARNRMRAAISASFQRAKLGKADAMRICADVLKVKSLDSLADVKASGLLKIVNAQKIEAI